MTRRRIHIIGGLLWGASALASAANGLAFDRRVEGSTCDRWIGDAHLHLEASENDAHWIDLDARDWRLDQPVEYRVEGQGLVARERYQVGDGAVSVVVTLRPEEGRFEADLVPHPIGDFEQALANYLPGLVLPCRASGSLHVAKVSEAGREVDPDTTLRVYRLLHAASEALYEPDFGRAARLLDDAEALAPGFSEIQWRIARVHYLRGESLPPDDRNDRLQAFERAERAADRAVELAPQRGEGWLWRAVARGRILSTQGNLKVVLLALVGGEDERGPGWVSHCFERAIDSGLTYQSFGHSAYADALYGAAQLYRLTPRGFLVRTALGFEGDLDRAVELLRRATQQQPLRIEYAKELGVALLCRGAESEAPGDLLEARRVLGLASKLAPRGPLDEIDLRHVGALLTAEPKRACFYSRDGWQDGGGAVGTGS